MEFTVPISVKNTALLNSQSITVKQIRFKIVIFKNCSHFNPITVFPPLFDPQFLLFDWNLDYHIEW